jgi:TM2 domain-containing membrane protein YozV
MTASESQRMMAYDAQKKSVLVAYLLWWFLGSLGAHRFYLGKTGSAVAMLVITLVSIPAMLVLIGFVGIAAVGVWWIVDAFLIPGIAKIHNMQLAQRIG